MEGLAAAPAQPDDAAAALVRDILQQYDRRMATHAAQVRKSGRRRARGGVRGIGAATPGTARMNPCSGVVSQACKAGPRPRLRQISLPAAASRTLSTRTLRALGLAQGRAKPDMIAFSELKDKLAPPRQHGHVAGVKPGDQFKGRGQLAILSLHSQMMRGIDNA